MRTTVLAGKIKGQRAPRSHSPLLSPLPSPPPFFLSPFFFCVLCNCSPASLQYIWGLSRPHSLLLFVFPLVNLLYSAKIFNSIGVCYSFLLIVVQCARCNRTIATEHKIKKTSRNKYRGRFTCPFFFVVVFVTEN